MGLFGQTRTTTAVHVHACTLYILDRGYTHVHVSVPQEINVYCTGQCLSLPRRDACSLRSFFCFSFSFSSLSFVARPEDSRMNGCLLFSSLK